MPYAWNLLINSSQYRYLNYRITRVGEEKGNDKMRLSLLSLI